MADMPSIVVSLRGEAPEGSGIVNTVLIDQLEQLLERVKRGEVVALGYFGVKPNREIFTGWDGCSRGYTHEMVSAVNTIQFRMMRMNVPDET